MFPAYSDLLKQRPLILFGKWRGPVAERSIDGETGQGDYSASLDVASVQPDSENPALRYLWARNRIAELSDYGAETVDADKVKQITALGLKYNLLAPYTSFIAVREKIVNPNGAADDVDQPLPLPLGVSDFAVGAEPELIWLFGSLVIIAIVIAVRRRISFSEPGFQSLTR